MHPTPSQDDSLNPEQQSEIDQLCDRFEFALEANENPTIESYLEELPDELRPAGFYELLRIEMELGNSDSDTPNLADYRDRFPEFQAKIDAVILKKQRGETSTECHTAPRDSRGLHIRCPYCSNGVELLADTPYEDITCLSCGSSFNLAVREDKTSVATPLREIGRFELISRLGLGGFGTVWKARDTELDRVVAVKIPRKGKLNESETEQFFREARAAAQLRHPHIVPVHEVGRDGDTMFIVSDLVRGVTLSSWLTGQRPDIRTISSMCKTIAEALHYAHDNGVIHRDLKPSNIMLDLSGVPHIMDFGLAKREINEITITLEGQIIGTPAYMSPEQAGGHGHWTDRRTDIYSLGVILFELLTGEQPFRGNAQMQVHQRLVEDAPDPRMLNRLLPFDLSTICLRCLERDPNGRYSNAQKVADELQRFLEGKPILARPISRLNRLGRWCRRNPAKSVAAGLIVFLSIAGPLVAWQIETQRRRLTELVSEKNNLIERVTKDKQASINTVSKLQQELDTWTGQANPWQLWPPKQGEGPRSLLIKRAFENHYQPMVDKLSKENELSQADRVLALLAIAMLADHSGHSELAIQHYEQAKETLQQLALESPQAPKQLRRLADCHVQLSRLYANDRKQAAEASLLAAIDIYTTLAAASPEVDNATLVARVDAEMRRALFSGFKNAGPQLSKAAELSESLDRVWPTDPGEYYQLVNLLVESNSTHRYDQTKPPASQAANSSQSK